MLAVNSLCVDVSSQRLLDDISFTLKPGECLCIVGESGSGKTTLLKTLLGLMPFSQGQISYQFAEEDCQLNPGHQYLGLPGVSWVMQNPLAALNPLQPVGRAVAESLYHKSLSKQKEAERVAAAFRKVELSPELARRLPSQLSIGQAQRVCIARALVCLPEVIIFDEPLSALDAVVQKQIAWVIDGIKTAHRLSYLFVTHDLGFADAYADKILLLRDGCVEAYQPVEEFFSAPTSDYGAELIEAARILGSLDAPAAMAPVLLEASA
ncbi:ABC transporter ATP-binding protein [Motiliproteus sp. MSK22-1]|uniref:ABC transporter ATP-binding protein n=1 Tax=Motiliproteus sp. MSK22-1 TaxID=1897630 RepID=UPI000975884E|nr:ATP-binding cassette domain-containing protein [Motiliproteus sp. MSK22-1]OMH33567.1 hypothetical protein BGP75_11085 [Motiliproteus sp. MSK22-1]